MLDYSEIIPAGLYLGAAPRNDQLDQLHALGISAVLSILHESDGYATSSDLASRFDRARVPIKDSYLGGVPDVAHIDEAVKRIEAWRSAGRTVYLHCMLGVGRSPLIAMAYLATTRTDRGGPGSSRLTTVISRIKQCRPKADPNLHQLRALCDYVEMRHEALHAR